VVAQLRRYLDDHPGDSVEVHLVGHSAGSIFLAGLIKQLKAEGIPVESLTYLAAAIRTDEWMRNVLPRLRQGDIKRFTAFGMNSARELDDVCGAGRVAVYRKSLLYRVSRAFERPVDPDATEVPLVGMARFADEVVGRTSYAQAVRGLKDGVLVWSPTAKPPDCRSDSSTHGGFDDDNPTMTSVLLRILRSTSVQSGNEYVPNLQPGTSPAGVAEAATEIAPQPPEVVTAEVHAEQPTPELPAAAAAPPEVATASGVRHPDERVGGTGNRVIDALKRDGWNVSLPDETEVPGSATARRAPRRSTPKQRRE